MKLRQMREEKKAMDANDKAKLIANRMREWDDVAIHGLDYYMRARARRNLAALARKYPGIAVHLLLYSLQGCVNDLSSVGEKARGKK
jgi:hypothetical protein